MADTWAKNILDVLTSIARGLDDMFLGGAIGNTFDAWNKAEKSIWGTSDQQAKANSLREMIDEAFAKAEAGETIELEKLSDRIQKASEPLFSSVPGLQQKVNRLRQSVKNEYDTKVLEHVGKQAKRDAATAAADAYASLSDEERAKANNPNSRAGRYKADFDKKFSEAAASSDLVYGPPAPSNVELPVK